ncbi:MAG TPA: DUF5668 domain-containing protein [Bacteroidota bacterium]|nr:DUF5668 domain-containing protein [Bacteroidota bacterium]
MGSEKPGISWFGVALILCGIVLLLRNYDLIDVEFSTVLWSLFILFGLVEVSRGFSRDRRGKIFWGTVIFLYGLFFFIRSLDYVYVRPYLFLPASFVIFGLAFLMMYLNNLQDWSLLIPSILLSSIGVLFMLTEFGYLYHWEVWHIIQVYWPLALILVGIGIIIRYRSKVPPNEMSS